MSVKVSCTVLRRVLVGDYQFDSNHGVVVTIDTFSSHKTEEGYLSHRYDSIYHDPKTGELKAGKTDFEDNYEKVGGYYILTSRVITGEENGETVTKEFGFSNIKLLQPAMV
ncbi:MAG: DUF3386 family protein [Crocosphaera sp.]|nr:DUF3386 family protein [Crocosphaera sp.]